MLVNDNSSSLRVTISTSGAAMTWNDMEGTTDDFATDTDFGGMWDTLVLGLPVNGSLW